MENLNHNVEIIDKNKKNNYLEFETKNDFENFVNNKFNEFNIQINALKKENKNLKFLEIENTKMNKIIDNFKKSILRKYDVSNFDFSNENLDFSNLDNFEKSILKQFENKNINYKKNNSSINNEKKYKKLFW